MSPTSRTRRFKCCSAEVLLDAISQVHDRARTIPARTGFAAGGPASGPVQGSAFLKSFGKPDRLLTCECERSEATTLTQAFQMINGETVRSKLEMPSNRIGKRLQAGVSDSDLLSEVYLAAVSREPSEAERTAVEPPLQHASRPAQRLGRRGLGRAQQQGVPVTALKMGRAEDNASGCPGLFARLAGSSPPPPPLQAGSAGIAGLCLPSLLRAEQSGGLIPRAKHIIFLHQFGGPSHLDTFDMKPDAPDGIRGEFKPIATAVPGLVGDGAPAAVCDGDRPLRAGSLGQPPHEEPQLGDLLQPDRPRPAAGRHPAARHPGALSRPTEHGRQAQAGRRPGGAQLRFLSPRAARRQHHARPACQLPGQGVSTPSSSPRTRTLPISAFPS